MDSITPQDPKVEAYITPALKALIIEKCKVKGITQAEGLRRALEAWVGDE